MRRLALGVATGVLLLAGCSGAPASHAIPLFAHLAVARTFHTSHPTTVVGLPSSIAEIAPGNYLVCDYNDVYQLSRAGSGYSATRLAAPAGVAWSPTGLAYRNGLVYVANNQGHDVLELRLTGNGFELVRRLTNPEMRTPQNVAIGSDGSVVVADTGGDGLLKFQPDGTFQWRLPLRSPHGVAASGDFIYASSLTDRTIYQVDQTGQVRKAVGALGASLEHYLWPVGLAVASGDILVTDALNGRVTTLDENLKAVYTVGGNGPGLDALNYPYATLPVSDGFLIVDTYKRRLVHTNRRWEIQEQVALGRMVPSGRQRPLVYVTDAQPYTYPMLPGVDIAAELGLRRSISFVGGFDGLDHLGSGGYFHLDLTDPQIGFTNATWAEKVGSLIAIGSPENDWLEVIDPTTGMFTYVDVGMDSWWRAGALLLSSNLRLSLAQAIQPAQAAFLRAQQLLAQGASPQAAFDQALSRGVPRNWSADLASAPAQQFLAGGATRQGANAYFAWAIQQQRLSVLELLEVKYLSRS